MATPIVNPIGSGKFDWKTLIPILEMAGNTAALLVPGGAPFVPLLTALEASLNPILQNIGTPQATATNTIIGFYGTAIAVLNIALLKTGIDPATKQKIEAYITSSQDALQGYLTANAGFDPSEYTQVTPIT